jgi:hypothetical protein
MCNPKRKGNTRAGQSLIETCLAVMMIGLIFAGLLQVSQIFAAKEVLQHSALCAARAKTVGFNKWMVEKSMLVAAIPISGKMLVPDFQNINAGLEQNVTTNTPGGLWKSLLGQTTSSAQYDIEKARIPDYLASWNNARAAFELNYACWEDSSQNKITVDIEGDAMSSGGSSEGSPMIHATVSQDYPLWVPLHQAFYAADSVKLSADSYLENHYPLYIDDQYR